jgi:hypothetical protein
MNESGFLGDLSAWYDNLDLNPFDEGSVLEDVDLAPGFGNRILGIEDKDPGEIVGDVARGITKGFLGVDPLVLLLILFVAFLAFRKVIA